MNDAFQRLKNKSLSGELLSEYAQFIRYNLGTHKKTRLKIAGLINSRSLLHDDVSKVHAQKLSQEFKLHAKLIKSNTANRLRFLTVLEELTEPSIEDVEPAVKNLEANIKSTLGFLRIWYRGTIELELINLNLLQRIKGSREDEARKLHVLTNLWKKTDFDGLLIPVDTSTPKILVHCHVVVDLGEDFDKAEIALRKRIEKNYSWKRSPYQVELKSLFKNNSTASNLHKIAAYVTKGGNENLRYNAGFGRDLAEDLDAKIWRSGLGAVKHGAETIEDERGLTIGEVQLLDGLYVWLMKRRKDRRGYLVGSRGI